MVARLDPLAILRFNVQEGLLGLPYLWDISVEGSGLHRVLPSSNQPAGGECCGKWMADGKYFLFLSGNQVWSLRSKGTLFQPEPRPVQLTSSPMAMDSLLAGTDGKKLFVVGRLLRGELVRYNLKTGSFATFLGGISAEFLDFSKDGQWVAYVSYPEGTLWRSRTDGSERLQLTFPTAVAANPRWSPDGRMIAFYEAGSDNPSRMYGIAAEGGAVSQLLPGDTEHQVDPYWSPDGSKIVFGGNGNDPASVIRVLDLATNHVATLAGSQGIFSPRWSPDGRYVAALSVDLNRLLLFDFQTQKWTELAKGGVTWNTWSKDGQYLQFLDPNGGTAIIRVRLKDNKLERVADLKNFPHIVPGWLGLAPDDSPLLLRDAGSQDIYTLDWEEP